MEFRFNLSFHEKMGVYLPCGFVKTSQENDFKLATTDILASLAFEKQPMNKTLDVLLKICHEVQTKILFEKFNKQKKHKNFESVLKVDVLKKAVTEYCLQKLDLFLNSIQDTEIPLHFEVLSERNFNRNQINIEKYLELTPLFYFENLNENLIYELTLSIKDQKVIPSEHEITILTPQSEWILIDKKLGKIKNVNAAKLKPFLNKRQLFIEEKLKINYFQKFVKDIIKNAEVEAKGFEVQKINTLRNASLKAVYHFFDDVYYLDLMYYYDDYLFLESKNQKNHVVIDVFEQELKVKHYERNINEEKIVLELLEKQGFYKNSDGLWNHQENKNAKSNAVTFNLEKLQTKKACFEKYLLHGETIFLDGKLLYIEKPTLNEVVKESIDWFEIDYSISISEFYLKFTDLFDHLKKKKNFYEFSKNKLMMIPNVWFEQFNSLLSVVDVANEKMRVSRHHIHLLEHINLNTKKEDEISLELKEFNGTLRPYQREGVHWMIGLYNNKFGGCLADDMGLGKTIQTIAFLNSVYWNLQEENTQDWFPNDLFSIKKSKQLSLKSMIIMPTSLLYNWYEELKKFAPHLDVLKYEGKDRNLFQSRLLNYDVVLTSYAILSKDISIFEKLTFECLIIDESHYLKNTQSMTYQNILKLKSNFKLTLTGTPFENSINELWAQMNVLNSGLLGTKSSFQKKYNTNVKGKDNINFTILKQTIEPFILRRTRKEVLDELPDYTEQIIYSNMGEQQRELYESEKAKIRNHLLKVNTNNSTHNFHVLKSLMLLRQISIHPKLVDEKSEINAAKFEDITNTIKTLVSSKQKTLIFSSFVKNIQIYEQWCSENKIQYVTLTGHEKSENRPRIIEKFKSQSEINIFFISTKTGNTGLNLTEASFVLILDPWWNPHVEFQAIARAHRMGQKQKVNVIKFITNDTIESKIKILQERKKDLFDQIFEKSELSTQNSILDFIPELL